MELCDLGAKRKQQLLPSEAMKPTTKPIVLLDRGDDSEPLDVADLAAQLDAGEISSESLAACEGMPAWRSVSEAIVWACAPLVAPVRMEFERVLQRLVEGGVMADARVELVKATGRAGYVLTDPEKSAIAHLLEANAFLKSAERHYESNIGIAAVLYPAYELVERIPLSFPRDWRAAWKDAGGHLFQGRMMAPIGDPVWLALSDFGFPFPPFSLETGMDIDPVPASECEALGVCGRGAIHAGDDFNYTTRLIGIDLT